MYTQTVFELGQEAERLLQLALQHLDAIRQLPASGDSQATVVPESGASATVHSFHFSLRGTEVQRDILQSELRKITRQEMVLAIVGTMKAGKSTTINAIIGTEVLPNRNRPMTALPTLIRHTPGQKEPRLYFPYAQPIDALMHKLHECLVNYDREMLSNSLEIDKDMEALIARIIQGQSFEKYYLGAQPIFYCLKSLNDLVRLSRVLNVEFPFGAYAAIEHIPVIEVEFVHLAQRGEGFGQLTLLDTPGPNEAGQPHLQLMLEDQLNRASAVMMILDYTQLKSISDEDVRQAVASVGKSVPLYALVNKFDQKDRNSDDEDQVRALVSGSLMKGVISPEHIFPVSSMWAYLANRARNELDEHGKLPDHQAQRWVQDFAEAALGRRWQRTDLDDIPHIRHAAEMLWEDALLDEPIHTILHAAHANASLYALRSASHKLLNYAGHAEEFLQLRAQGLDIDDEKLQENITRLQLDIQLLQTRQEEVVNEVQHEVSGFLGLVSNALAECEKEVGSALAWYFSHGQVPRRSLPLGTRLTMVEEADFLPGESAIMLTNEAMARMTLQKIRTSCETILLTAQQHISAELTRQMGNLETTLSRILHETLAPFENRLVSGLESAGFSASISLPAFQGSTLNFSVPQLFNEALSEESVGVAQVGQQGMRSALSRWLSGADWRWENASAMQMRYVINLNDLQNNLVQHIAHFCGQIRSAIRAQVDVAVTGCMATFFADVTHALEAIQANLNHSLVVRQQSQEAQQVLRQQLHQSLSTVKFIYDDTRLLREDIQTLLTAEK